MSYSLKNLCFREEWLTKHQIATEWMNVMDSIYRPDEGGGFEFKVTFKNNLMLNFLKAVKYYMLTMLLFSHQVISDSLWPKGLQHVRPPSPSPRVCPMSCLYDYKLIVNALWGIFQNINNQLFKGKEMYFPLPLNYNFTLSKFFSVSTVCF